MEHEFQVNFCTNPYCRWFGRPQKRFGNIRNKPYRYKLVGSDHSESKRIECNPDPENPNGTAGGCQTTPMSNWSVADEIARLAQNDAVRDVEPVYEFHREECEQVSVTPFDSPQFIAVGQVVASRKNGSARCARRSQMYFQDSEKHFPTTNSEMTYCLSSQGFW